MTHRPAVTLVIEPETEDDLTLTLTLYPNANPNPITLTLTPTLFLTLTLAPTLTPTCAARGGQHDLAAARGGPGRARALRRAADQGGGRPEPKEHGERSLVRVRGQGLRAGLRVIIGEHRRGRERSLGRGIRPQDSLV